MVFRGEVYKWGEIRKSEDSERSIKECVIIIQNDYENAFSNNTIALFCTSDYEMRNPLRFSFRLTRQTLCDYDSYNLGFFDECTMFVSHIKGINRKSLGKYLGTMNTKFMNILQPSIDFCLGLKRSLNVDIAQLKILSTVKVADLFRISESNVSIYEKVEHYLKLFNFDMSKNGVNYILKAILIAYKLKRYRLEDLAEIVAEQELIEAEEVFRVIIARIKENFGFRESPAISFIRLIDSLLKKG